jgi:hypothetical protein
MTTRSGAPSVDCALASPNSMACAVDETMIVAISSAIAVAIKKRKGARIDTAGLGPK